MNCLRLLLIAGITLAGSARAATLNIGDPAPSLQIAHWVKGSPVDGFETGRVYVVEFWATWCGPCKESIPHLTELAHQFQDKVTFIGVDVMEQDTNTVVKFVHREGGKMDYHVAIDRPEGVMADTWLKAAGQNGIPSAFVVDGAGRIAWIGHPMDSLDKTLDQVLAGTWDPALAGKRLAARQQAQALFNEGMQGAEDASILERAKKLEVLDREVGGFIPGQKFDAAEFLQQIHFSSAMDTYQKAVMEGEDAATLDQLEAKVRGQSPKDYDFESINKRVRLGLGAAKAQRLFDAYLAAVGAGGDPEKAADLSRQLAGLKLKNPAQYDVFARKLLTSPDILRRDVPLATQLAKSAVDLSDGNNATFQDTYALALSTAGKIPEAIAAEKRAVELAKTDDDKAHFQATLQDFQAPPSGAK